MTAVDKAVARAVKAYAAYRGKDDISDEGEVLTDMLADLMHFVDRLVEDREIGDFDTLLDSARFHYEAEREERNGR